MALDTLQERMSAIHPYSPWRGPLVDATESGFNVGNRQAAAFFYSGIASGTATPGGKLVFHSPVIRGTLL